MRLYTVQAFQNEKPVALSQLSLAFSTYAAAEEFASTIADIWGMAIVVELISIGL